MIADKFVDLYAHNSGRRDKLIAVVDCLASPDDERRTNEGRFHGGVEG